MIQALDYGDRFPIFLLVAGAEIEDFLGIPRHFYLTRDTVRRLLVVQRALPGPVRLVIEADS